MILKVQEISKPGHHGIPAFRKSKKKDYEFKINSNKNKTKAENGSHTCNPSSCTWGAKAKGLLRVKGHLVSEFQARAGGSPVS